MAKIKVKNFGPILQGCTENDGWVEIKKVTLFIGDQASGKSTIAKLISTFTWLEKALYRGDIDNITTEEFKGEYCSYHRLYDFFQPHTELYFDGDYYSFKFSNDCFFFQPIAHAHRMVVPKIMYVPAERSFLGTVKGADEVKGLPRPLFTFLDEFERSLNELKGILDLPIGNLHLEYDKSLKSAYILGETYKIKLLDASSGLHSLVPMFVVTQNLSATVANKENDPSKSNLSVRQEQRKREQKNALKLQFGELTEASEPEFYKQIEAIDAKFINNRFCNIVEEPEQNLYPTSQRAILNKLLECNSHSGNNLVITTHSPYLINYLSIAIQGAYLHEKINTQVNIDETSLRSLAQIVPLKAVIDGKNVVVYELREGIIKELPSPEGIPSDKNYLNISLAECNHLFDSLLELEQKL